MSRVSNKENRVDGWSTKQLALACPRGIADESFRSNGECVRPRPVSQFSRSSRPCREDCYCYCPSRFVQYSNGAILLFLFPHGFPRGRISRAILQRFIESSLKQRITAREFISNLLSTERHYGGGDHRTFERYATIVTHLFRRDNVYIVTVFSNFL